tara:strand:- start:1276 stop:1800 length:525 start_codon:yes stop_codon:yes gene_type:complete
MNRSLRKTAASVSVTYSHGKFSNDLTGTEFELELSEKDICLSINLWGNLSVRKKSANCYSDACELAEDHALLKSVQIDDSQMIDGLLNAHQKSSKCLLESQAATRRKRYFRLFSQTRNGERQRFPERMLTYNKAHQCAAGGRRTPLILRLRLHSKGAVVRWRYIFKEVLCFVPT